MIDFTTPRTRNIARPDATLRGEELGVGPTVLLLHAGGERRRVWAPVIEVLVNAGFRCVAFDQRGHGDSDGVSKALEPCAADVAAMLCDEPTRCVVVGASLGGFAAIVAMGDPAVRARVAGLVLVDTAPDFEPDRVRRFLGGRFDAEPEIANDIFAQIPLMRQITAELELPISLIRGGSGSALTDEDVERLLRLAPHTSVTHIRDAGHLVARDQPVALAETIAGAWAQW